MFFKERGIQFITGISKSTGYKIFVKIMKTLLLIYLISVPIHYRRACSSEGAKVSSPAPSIAFAINPQIFHTKLLTPTARPIRHTRCQQQAQATIHRDTTTRIGRFNTQLLILRHDRHGGDHQYKTAAKTSLR
jgi:hypothetical protein